MQQLDFSLFQPLNGSTPFRFVSAHPTEPLVALHAALDVQILQAPTFSRANIRCAIWNRETRELVSEPQGAVALAWNAAGNEMGLVRERYQRPSNDKSAIPGLFRYTWERYSWPEQKLLHSCVLPFRTCWPEIVVFSPLGDLAVVQWFEAEKSGLNFLGLSTYGDTLLDDEDMPLIESDEEFSEEEDAQEQGKWNWHAILFGEEEEEEEDRRFFVETNLATAPVFSPDGRFLVFCWQQRQRWWTDVPDDMYVEGDLPARIGECHVGYAQIIDGETNTTRRLALFANLPPGWQPSYEGDRSNELLNEPVFIDSRHFQVRLPTGETAVYTVLV